jgi:phosphoadenosine phosphosulfate reductase
MTEAPVPPYDPGNPRLWLKDVLTASWRKPVQLSAFNPEDVILSAWLAEDEPSVPILFLETGKHFPETLRYVAEIRERYGLKTLKFLYPDADKLTRIDPKGDLWGYQVNRCCHLRKVEPLERELEAEGYGLLMTGLRREQTPERHDMAPAALDDKGRLKVSPLFSWTREQRDAYMKEHEIPHHPLYALGYKSIGCAPCTTPVFPGEQERAGRWRHTRLAAEGGGKTECGLHAAQNKEGN